MNDDEIIAPAAERFGLDPQEAVLTLRYAAASKVVAEQAEAANPDELRRLRDIRRLWNLRLTLYQKQKAAARLPDPLQTPAQYRVAANLAATRSDILKLEAKLYGPDRVSEKDAGAREVKRRKYAYARAACPWAIEPARASRTLVISLCVMGMFRHSYDDVPTDVTDFERGGPVIQARLP